MSRLERHGYSLLVVLVLSAVPCLSQVDRGAITGIVEDTSGTVVPGTRVVVVDGSRSVERNSIANSEGNYLVPDLPIGTYVVTFSAPGFQGTRYSGVEIRIGQTQTLNPVLAVAHAKSDEVTVSAPLAQVDQESATLSESLEAAAIQDLPLNGRNWASLTALTPGAIDQGGSNQRSIRFAGRGRDDNNFTFDGVDATGIVNQAQKAYIRLAIPVSSISEFRVDTLLPTAELGDANGAQILVASRAGGNRFDGELFEYVRNSYFDARSPFDLTRGPKPFRLNQFGGNLGGPIQKNKTFFFFNFEGIQQVLDQTLIGFVPNLTVRSQVLARSPALSQIVNAYPLGNGPVTSGAQQWIGTGRQVDTENSVMIRIDHRFTDSTSAYVRFNYDNAISTVPLGSLTDRQQTDAAPLNGVAELLKVFSPSLVNEFKFGTNQVVSHTANLTPLPYTVNVSGFTALNGDQTSNQDGRTFSWQDSVSLVKGHHILKAGVEIRRIELNEGNSFSGTLTYSSLSDFVANRLDSATYLALLPLKRMRKTAYFGYVQDEFKVTPHLTVNLGLRYEFYNTFHEANDRAIPFDFGTCGGFCAPGSAFLFPAKDNIDPRVGIAWSPAHSQGHTVLRTGYGIYHEDGQLDDQNFPIANDEPRYSLTLGAQFPTLSYPFAALLPNATGVLTPKDLVRNRKDAYTQQWSASIQQSLFKSFTGTISYLGSKGTDIMNRSYTNLLNPATKLRPYPQFGQIELRSNNSNSEFNAMQLTLQRSFRGGWLLSANYMWSHALDDASLGSGVEDDFPENVSCRRCDHASSDQDARHSFSVFNIYQLPFGQGRRFLSQPGLLRAIAGGWELAAVAAGRSGLPVNITVDRSPSALPDGNSANQRPNLIAGIPLMPAQGQSPNLWINPAAFAAPAAGTWGNLGLNAFRGPALWQIDTALSRRITLREHAGLEFRAECFNLLNRAQFANPLADISAPASFGHITSLVNTGPTGSGTPREFELSMKLVF